jgi:nucleoside-diphosphate-sugar epimerase
VGLEARAVSRRPTLVTGATGFLGGRVCAVLVARGERVVAMGRDPSRFPALDPRLLRRHVADLADEAALREACRGVDTVVHSAALSTAWGPRQELLRVNVEGTHRLLAAARAAGVRRFVHVSSPSVVFANRDRLGIDESEPYPDRFTSAYAESKALAEQAVRAERGLETVILRPRAIFGPGDVALLPRLVRAGRAGWLRIVGSGRNVQDLTYVDNAAHALLLARDAPAAAGRTYFVSNGEPVRLWDVIFQVFDALEIPRPRRRVPARVALAFASGLEVVHRLGLARGEPRLTRYTAALLARDQTLDIGAARRDLGYAPLVGMADALERTIAALRSGHGP